VGYRPDGKPDRRYVYGRTKTEVQIRLRELRDALARDELPTDLRLTNSPGGASPGLQAWG